MTEQEKELWLKRYKILKIKTRKFGHRSWQTTKKLGFSLGLWLVMQCGGLNGAQAQNISGGSNSGMRNNNFPELLAQVKSQNPTRSSKDLLAFVEKQTSVNINAQESVDRELSSQIEKLAEDFLVARSDSITATINTLKIRNLKNKEVRRNFKDATGYSRYADYCIATQCAADYRALRALGLGDIIPKSLMQNSAYCPAYLNDENIKPFAYEVTNSDEAIAQCIKEHNLSGGCFIFYPRKSVNKKTGKVQYSYHAVSVDMPEGELVYGDGEGTIKTSSANREHLGMPISTASFRKQCPTRKAVVVDKLGVIVNLLEQYIEGKNLAEQVDFLYSGGAEEFMSHLMMERPASSNPGVLAQANEALESGNQKEADKLFAQVGLSLLQQEANASGKSMSDVVLSAVKEKMAQGTDDSSAKASLFLLALIPFASRRTRKNEELLEVITEVNQIESFGDKLNNLCNGNGEKFVNAFSPDEYQQLVATMTASIPNSGEIKDANIAAVLSYDFGRRCAIENNLWHEVATPEVSHKKTNSNKKTANNQVRKGTRRSNTLTH